MQITDAGTEVFLKMVHSARDVSVKNCAYDSICDLPGQFVIPSNCPQNNSVLLVTLLPLPSPWSQRVGNSTGHAVQELCKYNLTFTYVTTPTLSTEYFWKFRDS